jgi:release factor glutamine methyltransferase
VIATVTMTVGEAIDRMARRLQAASIPEPRAEARRLVALALGVPAEELPAASGRDLSADETQTVDSFASRRAAHEPFAYIAGAREFWSLPFRVSPATLIPRPDTETVVEAALEWLRAVKRSTPRILDLGTGTGCILLALLFELPAATGIGIDASEAALAVAEDNAQALGLAARASFQGGRWTEGIDGPFDLIVSNPPYIPDGTIATLQSDVRDYEPHLALKGGIDGLDAYRAIVASAPALLAPNGALALEVGAGQADAVAALLRAAGLDIAAIRSDLSAIPRCVVATRPGN